MNPQCVAQTPMGFSLKFCNILHVCFISPLTYILFTFQNHLDLHAVLWLESYLVKWPKTCIIVSHAREFLNSVILCAFFFSSHLVIFKAQFLSVTHLHIYYPFRCLILCSVIFQVVTDILHLHGQKLTAYKGDYDTYERTRIEQLKNQQKAFESNERSRNHMQVFHHTNSSCLQHFDRTLIIQILYCTLYHVDSLLDFDLLSASKN